MAAKRVSVSYSGCMYIVSRRRQLFYRPRGCPPARPSVCPSVCHSSH